ncbi:MAG: adenosylmethionine--8-amino-7-oxononanoate transaminase, partial [Pyrinomonadaceae bacterium]
EKIAPHPIPIVRGEGVYLYLENGSRILDAISSWWVNIHGHSHPVLNEALARQASQFEHVMFAGFTHRPAVELAERLVDLLPSGLTRVFYSDNGSTAVEVALKMSYQYWRNLGQEDRRTFIALEHAYHGDTFGAMSASARSLFTAPFESFLFDIRRTTSPYLFRHPLGENPTICVQTCLNDLEKLLVEEGGKIAAVIIEPMLQGAGGMIIWPSEYLRGVRRLCDKYEVLMIVDEVLTGFGRTGRMFACEHALISPDIICLSKALTAGYLPLGATVATEKIYEGFLSDDRTKTFFHGHSYTANPLGCAVGLASLDLFRTEGTLERIRVLERKIERRLNQFKSIPHVGDIRMIGGVGVIELVQDQTTKAAGGYLDKVGPELATEFLKRGLLLRPLGNVIYFMPPYAINEKQTDWVFDQIMEVLMRWKWPEGEFNDT